MRHLDNCFSLMAHLAGWAPGTDFIEERQPGCTFWEPGEEHCRFAASFDALSLLDGLSVPPDKKVSFYLSRWFPITFVCHLMILKGQYFSKCFLNTGRAPENTEENTDNIFLPQDAGAYGAVYTNT